MNTLYYSDNLKVLREESKGDAQNHLELIIGDGGIGQELVVEMRKKQLI